MQKSVGKSQMSKCSTCGSAGRTALSGGQTDLVFLQGAAKWLQFDLDLSQGNARKKGEGFSLLHCSLSFLFMLSSCLSCITSMTAVCKFISSLHCHHVKLMWLHLHCASVCVMRLFQPRLSSITVSRTTSQQKEEDLVRNPRLGKTFFHPLDNGELAERCDRDKAVPGSISLHCKEASDAVACLAG